MEIKIGKYLAYSWLMICVWIAICQALPAESKIHDGTVKARSNEPSGDGKSRLSNSGHDGKEIFPTMGSDIFAQRNKRSATRQTHHGLGMFPDVRNADDALQKLMLLLTLANQKATVVVDDYDEEDNPAIDLVLGKEPVNTKSFGGNGQKSSIINLNGKEEPTGVPIVLYQHRMNKKSSPAQTMPEIVFKDVDNSSYERDAKIMRKLQKMFNRQSHAQMNSF